MSDTLDLSTESFSRFFKENREKRKKYHHNTSRKGSYEELRLRRRSQCFDGASGTNQEGEIKVDPASSHPSNDTGVWERERERER